MPSHRPQGRTARPEASSRKGQFYDSDINAVFHTDLGDLTARDYRAKLNRMESTERFSMVRQNDLVDSVFSRRSCVCGGKVNILSDGKAVCGNPSCSTVFNDGGNIEGMVQVTDIYDSGKKDSKILNSKWVPRKGEHGHSHLNKFVAECKA
jgi:hypothetical protein